MSTMFARAFVLNAEHCFVCGVECRMVDGGVAANPFECGY